MAKATAIAAPDVLNSSFFLSIGQVILSNLQTRWKWYKKFSTDEIDEFVGQNLGNYSNGDNNSSSSTKWSKFISFSINNRSGYSEQLTTILKMIHIDFDNVKYEIDKLVGQNPGNYGIGNGNSSTRYFKFITFSLTNRLVHF